MPTLLPLCCSRLGTQVESLTRATALEVCGIPSFSVLLQTQLVDNGYQLPFYHSHSVGMAHSLDASSTGDMPEVKEQRSRKAESFGKHRVITWWKTIIHGKTRVERPPDPPAPYVYVTAADVMKTPRETPPASDAKFQWRM